MAEGYNKTGSSPSPSGMKIHPPNFDESSTKFGGHVSAELPIHPPNFGGTDKLGPSVGTGPLGKIKAPNF